MKNKRSPPVKQLNAGCLLVLELISIFHHENTAGFVSQLCVGLNTASATAQLGPLGELWLVTEEGPASKAAKDFLLNHSKRHASQKSLYSVFCVLAD